MEEIISIITKIAVVHKRDAKWNKKCNLIVLDEKIEREKMVSCFENREENINLHCGAFVKIVQYGQAQQRKNRQNRNKLRLAVFAGKRKPA